MPPRRIIRARIQQGDIVVLALEWAAARHGGRISTRELKRLMIEKFKPTGADAILTPNGVTRFDQVVGNLISNRPTHRSMISMGYATRTPDGFAITPAGRAFLDTVPR
jgi:hypothetical protein